MKNHPINKDEIAESLAEISPVTSEQLQERARELAMLAGRVSLEVTQTDYTQAKRELMGQVEIERQEDLLESIPEAKRANGEPGTAGIQSPESPSEDEDAEGRSESEQLVEKGVEKAERDQVLQAAKDTAKKNRAEE